MTGTRPNGRGLPTPETALDLIKALLENAAALGADAALLLEHGRAPRAYALAVLSIEELGKTYPCLQVLLGDESLTAKQFWAGWREHAEKLDSAWAYHVAFLAGLDAVDFSRLAEVVGDMASRKMRGLYVDLEEEAIKSPGVIDAATASQMVELANNAIRHASAVFAPATSQMLPALAELAPILEHALEAAVDESDPVAALATLREWLGASQEQNADAIVALIQEALHEAGPVVDG